MLFGQRKVLAVCSIAFSIAATSAFADSDDNPKSDPAFVTAAGKTVSSKRKARGVRVQPAATAAYASASSSVVAEARRYIGSGPVFGRKTLWCGNFMDYVLRKTGHKSGGNLARGYASYGRRVAGPQVGALAVMTRGRGGGHVGVISGVDASGNVIVVSGNHNNVVAESVYPRSRIIAYVMPDA